MLAGPSTEASPLEILEQRQLIERLQAEHASDKVALHELSQLPKDRAVYQKRLNVFFKAKPEEVRARVTDSAAVKEKQLEAATRKFETVKAHVEASRDGRKEALGKLVAAGQTLSDPIWDGFGSGEKVTVVGLKNAPQYNGKTGTVERFDGERFVVRLEGKSAGVRIKPENLEPVGDRPAAAAFSGKVRERA